MKQRFLSLAAVLLSVTTLSVFALEEAADASKSIADKDSKDASLKVKTDKFELIEKALPTFKKTAQRPAKVTNDEISNGPLYGIRSVFTREYIRDATQQATGEAAQGGALKTTRQVKAYDYVDLMMLPVGLSFRVDKALALDERKPSEDKLSFTKYGLDWRKVENEFHSDILYLGHDEEYHYFAHATLPNLMSIKHALRLSAGFDDSYILAEALNVDDKDDFTKKTAVSYIGLIKDAALPEIANSIRSARLMNSPLYQHFQAVCLMNTDKSREFLSKYAEEEDSDVYLPVFDSVIIGTKPHPGLMEVYKKMIETQTNIPYPLEAAKQLKRQEELIPSLKKVTLAPKNFETYSIATTSIYVIEHPDAQTIHQEAIKQIILMLIRQGEVPKTLRMVTLDNKTPETIEHELSEKDEERVKPFMDEIINSQEDILNVVSALTLAMFDPKDPKVLPEYTSRVQMYGVRLLKALPQKQLVKTEMLKLIRGLKKDQEKLLLRTYYTDIFAK